MTATNEIESEIHFTCRTLISLRIDEEEGSEKKSCGFHVTRSKWDPYPWVGYVEPGSIADFAGLRAGDCLLEIDGVDVVGLRVKEIASLIKKEPGALINLQVWRNTDQNNLQDSHEDGAALSGPLPTLVRKLAKAVSGAVRTLECPVCLETATSPISQCVHGHILCAGCRIKTPRCPVCRVRLGRGRCLIADEVQRNIREAFEDSRAGKNNLTPTNHPSLREKLFGKLAKKLENSDHQKSHQGKTRPLQERFFMSGFNEPISLEEISKNGGKYIKIEDIPGASYRIIDVGSQHVPVFSESENLQEYHLKCNLSRSTESVNNISFPCPLAKKSNCKEVITIDGIDKHLEKTHIVPQVHFYDKKATIPIPLPFGPNTIYALHHDDGIFFFQYEDECAWMIGTRSDRHWVLYRWNISRKEVKILKPIAEIQVVASPSPAVLATIPNGVKEIDIQIVTISDGSLRF